MRETFSLGQVSGIRIGVNWSVLLIVALLAYGLAAGQFPAEAPHRPVAEYIAAAIITAVAYIASLLAHELAHSLVARRNGVKVEGITLTGHVRTWAEHDAVLGAALMAIGVIDVRDNLQVTG
jgi:Zn-dependent protease